MAEATGRPYKRGIAFVAEGDTERVFYHEYLVWCCNRYDGTTIERLPNKDYLVSMPGEYVLVKFNVMGSVSQVPNAAAWVRSTCHSGAADSWHVALCYDTDGNTAINLNTRAWKRFRDELTGLGLPVIDLAADADIEDVMLADIGGVRAHLGLPDTAVPTGRKGKAKMKSLYKIVDVTRPYHEGEKARELIRSLNFEAIENRSPIPISSVREFIFGDKQ